MYLQLPKGFITTGDAYTHRYDNIIKDVPYKAKITDDTLYDMTIEDSSYHTWDFLAVCAEKGIVINEKKSKFCRNTRLCRIKNHNVWGITIRQYSLCHQRLPNSNKHHWSTIMVWACKPSCLSICY